MEVTKFEQACVKVTKNNQSILFDPGKFSKDAYSGKVSDTFGKIEAVIFTHQHSDHFDNELLDELVAAHPGLEVYCNEAVAEFISAGANKIGGGQSFEAAGFKIQAFDLAHFDFGHPGMVVPNLGYLIDGVLLHPGDSWDWPNEQITKAGLPLYPGVKLAVLQAAIDKVGAKKVLMIHYEPPGFPDPKEVGTQLKNVEALVLSNGQSATL